MVHEFLQVAVDFLWVTELLDAFISTIGSGNLELFLLEPVSEGNTWDKWTAKGQGVILSKAVEGGIDANGNVIVLRVAADFGNCTAILA